MYAIVEISGKQFRVEKDMVLDVPLQNHQIGDSLEFNRVLLFDDGSDVKIGKPVLDGAKIAAKVLNHEREKKKIVFKKKRRKGYRVTKGHRQPFTKIQIEKIET